MESHFALTDETFAAQFAQGTLDPKIFTHEAHLRIAYIYLQRHGLAGAVERTCTHLLAYVDALGGRDKFNMTLTVAAVQVVHHFRQKAMAPDFAGLMQEFPRLKTHFRELIGQHYQLDIFQSAEAKERYLEPDLLPFS